MLCLRESCPDRLLFGGYCLGKAFLSNVAIRQMQTLTKSQLAGFVLAFFLLGSALVLIMEFAEQMGFISMLAEGVGRFAVWALLLGALGWLSSAMPLKGHIRWTGYACATFTLLDLMFDVTEDLPGLNDIAIVGRHSRIRPVLEKALMSGWPAASLVIVFFLFRSHTHVVAQAPRKT